MGGRTGTRRSENRPRSETASRYRLLRARPQVDKRQEATAFEEQPGPRIVEKCNGKGIKSVANEGGRAIGKVEAVLPRKPRPSLAETRNCRGTPGRSSHTAPPKALS